MVVAAAPRRGSPVARSVKDAFAAFAAVRRTEKAPHMYLRLYYIITHNNPPTSEFRTVTRV